jgi:hypothetical protein
MIPIENLLIGYASSPDWGLVISGGSGDEMYDVISTKDGKTFQTLKSLPIPFMYHCLVVIDSEELFISGGLSAGARFT